MNNEGLEALAALAAAAPAPSTGNVNEGEANKKDREKAAVVAESLPGAEPVDMAAAPAATNLPAHLAAQLQANPAQLHHLRAFGAQLQGAGPNPTAPELALLAASQLQQLPQQRNDISALQNMAYHHLLLQTQQAAAPQQPTAAAQISNTALTAAATQLASLLGLSQTAGNPAAAVNAHALLSATTAAQSKGEFLYATVKVVFICIIVMSTRGQGSLLLTGCTLGMVFLRSRFRGQLSRVRA